MKNVKFNLDRPHLDSNAIEAGKDFDGLLKNHAMMSKPIYKSPWFIGTTGLASIGIVVGGIVAMDYSETNTEPDKQNMTQTSAPPEHSGNNLIAMNSTIEPKNQATDLVKETFTYSENIQKQIDEENSTLEKNPKTQNINTSTPTETTVNKLNENQESEKLADQSTDQVIINEEDDAIETTDLMPRIGGKLNGSITKEELFDNKGITTESDVNVIHFELHLIDGLGGKVFEEESNQLTSEMKEALKKINSGETIYFENIKGQTDKGEIVRLNPLRYVLMN